VRVLLDTNIFVSFLLSPERIASLTHQAIELTFSEGVDLLMPEELLDELLHVLTTRPYMTARIAREDVEEFVEALRSTTVLLPSIKEPIPPVVRDPKDDYLIAQALLGQADYLVTRDEDLLSLGDIGHVRIITPAQFVRLFAHRDETEE
jgi:putative PIN family toxin of toxin-antitoxin system